MPVLDRSALEDAAGLAFLGDVFATPRPEQASPVGVLRSTSPLPDRLASTPSRCAVKFARLNSGRIPAVIHSHRP